MENEKRKSVYRTGAELGRYMGVYLIVMSALFIAGARVSGLTLLMTLMIPGIPMILYAIMRRIYRETPRFRTVSALWMVGNVTVICGILICALVTSLWLTFVEPDFVVNYLRSCLEVLQTSGQTAMYQEEVDLFNSMIKNGAVPSPMQFVLSMCWATAFLGCFFSMICAWIVVTRERRKAFSTSPRA